MRITVIQKKILVRCLCVAIIVLGIATVLLAAATLRQIALAIYRAHGAQQTIEKPARNGSEGQVEPSADETQTSGATTGDGRARSAKNPDYIEPSDRIQIAVNSLLLLVIFWQLVAVSIQAYIYAQQREVMRRQWIAMKRQLREVKTQSLLTKQNSIDAQRAYVVAKIRDIGVRDDTLQFRLRIQNGGNTPANNVRVSYASELRESPPWDMFAKPFSSLPEKQILFEGYLHRTERLGVVGPRGSYHVITTPETSFRSPEEYKRFEEGDLKFFCWGRIDYEDMFSEPRHTSFCFFQSPGTHAHGYPCEHGNQAT